MENITKTLAEQLQITDLEIEKRKKLLGFTKEDADLLRSYKPMIDKYLDGIVKTFYDEQLKVPEISLLIGDAETFRRLENAMHRYVLDLFDGHYDTEYVNRRLRIGKVHQRIGVSSKLYLAATYQLQKIINNTFLMHLASEGNFIEAEKIRISVHKIMTFDVQLILDTYISSLVNEVDNAREELRQYSDSLQEMVAEKTLQLKELSLRDSLTGLFNQHAFFDHLRRELANAERYRESVTLLYFDLNGFKQLNDREGHQAGDEILSLVGDIIRESIRETDIGCRYGGDEFCIILPRTSMESSELIKERLIKCFKEHDTKSVTFSLGIVDTGPESFIDYESLVKKADEEMYKAKEQSKIKPGIQVSIASCN